MDILTGLLAISETLKITKELRNIDDKIAVAELKLRLSDLVDGLLEAREALQDAKEREAELRNTILKLQAELVLSDEIQVDDFGRLFRIDPDGRRKEGAYCNQCFTKEGKLFRLRMNPNTNDRLFCGNCDFWCERA